MAGNGFAGTSTIFQCGSRGEDGGDPSSKPNLLGTGGLRGNEACYGDVQQPHVAVVSPTAPSELPVSTDPLLPLPHLGDAPLQSPHKHGTTTVPPILLPPPGSGKFPNPLEQCRDGPGLHNSGEQRGEGDPPAGSSQHLSFDIPVLNQREEVEQQEVEDAIALMRETRLEIVVLKNIKIVIFKQRFDKKLILICPPNLSKSSIDIRVPTNPDIRNFVVIMNPSLRMEREEDLAENTTTLNRSINIIVWNCRGCNGEDFRRNFRALIDWHKPPLVALVETKMQDHQALLDNFPFNNMIQVSAVGNSGGLGMLWDDDVLEIDDVATTGQEIHAMVKYV
ncbi:hypothetical protein KY285_032168 [Solanum tuberosum]|nr:hypothetical protein KY284_031388 [Solanum tuberosum]KAH0654125.1 hypothetical protein KY289_031803 [Solanum tuberosum]KAH0657286.1 hypothetical protein KY285_032168 [Solanum tuberosum]